MRYLIAASLLVASFIHWIPLSGLLGSERLASMYGVTIVDPTLVMLMRHRAVLFGIVGALLLLAAFRPALQPAAFVVGLVSIVSFLWLARPADAFGPAIARVVTADIVALLALIVGAVAYMYLRLRGS
jgi:hypothetical protein